MSGEASHEHGASTGIVCHHVLTRERSVNLVCHSPDGIWDFMCGEEDGHDEPENASVVCTGCAFQDFIKGISAEDVPVGYIAERPDAGKRWVIRPMNAEELSELEEE